MASFVAPRVALVVAADAVTALLSVVAATGLLYILRSDVSGPQVGDALPLDELPRRAGVSVLLFALVWSGVGLCAVLGAGRREGGRLIGFVAAVWLWEFSATTISVGVVRQEPIAAAAVAVLNIPVVYLALLVVISAAFATARLAPRRLRSPGRLELTN
jgi:hypothetical protein